MAFQPVGKVFSGRKTPRFIVAGSAVLERILSIVDHGTGSACCSFIWISQTVE